MELAARALGDGHPVVPVTDERLDRMLSGVAEPARSFGHVPPGMGEVTPQAAAYFAVLAGCPPTTLPIVLAALEACLSDEFNLLGILTTTSAVAVTVVVGGSQTNPGERASGHGFWPSPPGVAGLGRAVALALRGLGLATAGLTPFSTVGQPGQFGSCLVEGVHPFAAPLHVRRGSACTDRCVTVFATAGFVEIEDGARHAARSVTQSFRDAMLHPEPGRDGRPREELMVIPLEVADTFFASDWNLERAQAEAAAPPGATTPPEGLSPCVVVAGDVGWKCAWLPAWVGGSRSVTRKLPNLES